MNTLLLDSHVLLWTLNSPDLLGPETKKALLDASNTVSVSVASIWELELKHLKGKLPFGAVDLLEGIETSGFELIDITPKHIAAYSDVQLPHKDPFDRLLIAVSVAQNAVFVTADRQILSSDHHTSSAKK